jgi:hypothetical protein
MYVREAGQNNSAVDIYERNIRSGWKAPSRSRRSSSRKHAIYNIEFAINELATQKASVKLWKQLRRRTSVDNAVNVAIKYRSF